MFSLLFGLWKYLFSKAEYHVLILGIDKAGKTLGLRTIWEKYYEEAHAVLYVVDAAGQNRFEDAKTALEKVLRHADLTGAPVLVFANKQDLAGAITGDELLKQFELEGLQDRPHMVKAVSAYDGSGVRDGVLWLVEAMKKSHRSELIKQRADAATVL
eukprot:jgi/Mesen1/4680/ME000241S03717